MCPFNTLVRTPLAYACIIFCAGYSNSVVAQTSNTPPQRVEVTGSAIKRMNSQSALPVQMISRDEIDASGSTTAAEIMAKVVGNIGALTDGVSLNTGGDQRGFNSVNLRGLGSSSTLILLNGRRLSNFASPGDDAGVGGNIGKSDFELGVGPQSLPALFLSADVRDGSIRHCEVFGRFIASAPKVNVDNRESGAIAVRKLQAADPADRHGFDAAALQLLVSAGKRYREDRRP